MSVLKELLEKAVRLGASDVHLKPMQEPFYRIQSRLVESGFEKLTPAAMERIVADLLPPHQAARFQTEHEADFSHYEDGVGRFRVNVYLAQGVPTMALRHVKKDIPTLADLRLPPQLNRLAEAERGIVILSGTTGSGKSTTLAAIIGQINRTQRRRIITVEDPVEFVFEDDQSVITQREIGLDTLSFANALKHLMRQDPDVILIGEMHNHNSIRTTLLAAETGHLVLTTLHAGTADLTVPRILDVFPTDEQQQIRMAFAANLYAVVCQRLLHDLEGRLCPAVEIMFNTPTVRKIIEKNQLELLGVAISTGGDDGMQNFNQSVYQLIKSGVITEEEGLQAATNPEALRMNLQGIFLDESRRILSV